MLSMLALRPPLSCRSWNPIWWDPPAKCRPCSIRSRTGRVEVLCGQGTTPAAATLERYRAEGLDLIPGNGLLATVIPGAFDAWMTLLRDHGTMRLRDVLEPAIYYAEAGHPLMPRISNTIAGPKDFFQAHWPSTAEIYLPGGNVPESRKLFRNPALARTWRRVLDEAERTGGDRDRQIEGARDAFYRGFVADAIDRFARGTEVMDESGKRHRGVITGQDMASWSASYDAPLTYDYHGYTVAKAGAWSQGPVFLQTLALLKDVDLAGVGPCSAEFVHRITEAMKLAFADREAYYGDPSFVDVPLAQLLSDDYSAARRALIGEHASLDLRPGRIPGFEGQVDRVMDDAVALVKGQRDRQCDHRADAGRHACLGQTRRHHARRRHRPLGQHDLGHAIGRLVRSRRRSSPNWASA